MLLKRFITTYLPMTIVLTVAVWAGVELYQQRDPELQTVEFVNNTEEQAHSNDVTTTEVVTEASAEEAIETETATHTNLVDPVSTGITTSQPVANTTTTTVAQPTITDTAAESTEEVTGIVTVTLSGPGVTKRCEVPFTTAITVHALMQQASSQCNFSYHIKNYTSLGVFVDELGGVESNRKQGKFWLYYVNGKKANVGVSAYTVSADDLIAWQYEQEY